MPWQITPMEVYVAVDSLSANTHSQTPTPPRPWTVHIGHMLQDPHHTFIFSVEAATTTRKLRTYEVFASQHPNVPRNSFLSLAHPDELSFFGTVIVLSRGDGKDAGGIRYHHLPLTRAGEVTAALMRYGDTARGRELWRQNKSKDYERAEDVFFDSFMLQLPY